MPVQHGTHHDPSTGTTWFWSYNYKLPDADPHRDPAAHAQPHPNAKDWDDPQKIAGRHKIVNSFGAFWPNDWGFLVDFMFACNNSNTELPNAKITCKK